MICADFGKCVVLLTDDIHKSCIEMKFPKESPRKVLERVKLAWQDAPQQVHEGYMELQMKVSQRFAIMYPKVVVPKTNLSSCQNAEGGRDLSDAGIGS